MEEEKIPVDPGCAARNVLEELRVTLVYGIGDGVIVTDVAGHITRMNPVASGLTGWSEVEALGRHLDEVLLIVSETSGVTIENPSERTLREGRTAGFANDALTIVRGGAARPVSVFSAPIFNEQGAIVGIVLIFHDQTTARAVQQALQDNEDLHRIIIENILDPVFITDSEGEITFVSPNVLQILGYSVDEIQAMGNISACVGEGRRLFDLEDLQRRGEISNIEAVIANKNGAHGDYLVTAKQVSIRSGTILYVCRDITELKRAEEEREARIRILESLERIDRAIKQETDVEQMLENTIRAVFSIFACDRAWLLYPCDPDAPSFRVPVEINKPEYPGAKVLGIDVPMSPKQAQDMRDALESDDPMIFIAGTEKAISTADQFGVQSQMFVPIYPKLGKPWVFGMHQCSYPRVWTKEDQELFKEIARRISDGLSSVLFLRELRENEERFRATFEQAAVGIAHVAPNGDLLRVNQKFCEIVGYSREELLQKTFQDITHPDDLDADLEYVRQVLAAEIPTYSMEKRYIRKDGSLVWINLTVSIVRGPIGDPTYFISVIEDIAERKKAEEEQRLLQGHLLQAQKMESVGRLAGGVAHDFNNMLSAILGHTEQALMRCDPSEPIHADLKVIEDSARRSADLTRQLLAFARKHPVAPKVLDVNVTVEVMLKMLLRLIGDDIGLVWMPGTDVWPVLIDPSQLDQLLANLCVNARDAINGVGRVTIQTRNVAFDEAYGAGHSGLACGEYVMLSVSDDGSGISNEVMDRLFEPFFTTKAMGKGTGLGLAIVYGIVKQNDGLIKVSSEPSKLTTFEIYLPRYLGEAVGPTAELAANACIAGGKTVLLVEDEPVLLNLGRKMLEEFGCVVLVAGTPEEALRQARAHSAEIELLITDVVLGEMNGRSLAKLIGDIRPGLKCLFVSSYSDDVVALRGVLDEHLNFLQKPFSKKELASKVNEVLMSK